jgi:hypothetical protein
MKTEEMMLDGNAIGGLMLELFGREMTMVISTCRSCGATGPLASVDVYMKAPGVVVRCRTCASVLMKIVRGPERVWLDVDGLRMMQLES